MIPVRVPTAPHGVVALWCGITQTGGWETEGQGPLGVHAVIVWGAAGRQVFKQENIKLWMFI